MKKEKAIIEYLEDSDRRVCVHSTFGDILEVCLDREAFRKYDIVGEIISGETRKFDGETEEEFESYDEYIDESEDED